MTAKREEHRKDRPALAAAKVLLLQGYRKIGLSDGYGAL
jgi:hypothetical protein